MSSAYYPLGMRSTPASGYNHKSSVPQQYISWKGTGLSKTPTGVTAGTIRPLTNKDYGNVFPAAFGKPRPIKHARKGSFQYLQPVNQTKTEGNLIEENRNLNRVVSSSTYGSLVKQMIDNPGSYSVSENTLSKQPSNCKGICISADLYPNLPFLTNNPEPISGTAKFCCNEERKARRRVQSAPTKLSPNYYTTHKQYLQNRCQTYEQRAFNFYSTGDPNAVPGTPQAMSNTYVANCFPSNCQSSCSNVIYKPNNPQFAQQGAVSSSTLMLKRNYDEINKNLANLSKYIIFKNKEPKCNPAPLTKPGNATTCKL
jgi:hypothetical protein